MLLKITWKYVVAFFALSSVISELHEQAHITTGRLINGCYGPRDFNNWEVCRQAVPELAFLPPLAGPLFTYAVLWAGVMLLLRGRSLPLRSLGFTLLFASLPFARVFTSLMGGGDEKNVLRFLFADSLAPGAGKVLAALVVIAVCAPPVCIAWRAIRHSRAWLAVAGFCILPLIAVWLIKFKLLGSLLASGLLADVLALGTPTLVLVFFLLMLALTIILFRHILSLGSEARR